MIIAYKKTNKQKTFLFHIDPSNEVQTKEVLERSCDMCQLAAIQETVKKPKYSDSGEIDLW